MKEKTKQLAQLQEQSNSPFLVLPSSVPLPFHSFSFFSPRYCITGCIFHHCHHYHHHHHHHNYSQRYPSSSTTMEHHLCTCRELPTTVRIWTDDHRTRCRGSGERDSDFRGGYPGPSPVTLLCFLLFLVLRYTQYILYYQSFLSVQCSGVKYTHYCSVTMSNIYSRTIFIFSI